MIRVDDWGYGQWKPRKCPLGKEFCTSGDESYIISQMGIFRIPAGDTCDGCISVCEDNDEKHFVECKYEGG